MPLLKRAARNTPKPPDQISQVGGWPALPWGAKGPDYLGPYWSAIYNGMLSVGNITADTARGIPAVSASLALMASYVSQMPLETVEDVEQTTRPPRVTPSPPILRNPIGVERATGQTFSDWICPALDDLALWGNYLAVLGPLDWSGWPSVMFPVGVGLWSVSETNGRVRYSIGDLELDPSEVFHVAINRGTGELVGKGLLSTHQDTLKAAIAAEQWAARYFETGVVPSVHIGHPNPDLTQDQAQALKDKFLAAAKGAREPVVTPVGTEITVLPVDAESAQLVESRRWSAQTLAMALGVPPAMLGLDAPSMTYRNITDVNQQFINTTIMRYLIPIEQQLTAQCLPRGFRARFNTNALLRPDLGTRIDQAQKAKDAGLITVDEARAWLDLMPEASLANEPPQAPAELQPAQPPAELPVQEPQLQVVGSTAQ